MRNNSIYRISFYPPYLNKSNISFNNFDKIYRFSKKAGTRHITLPKQISYICNEKMNFY